MASINEAVVPYPAGRHSRYDFQSLTHETRLR
jgi:hypothetical protein